LPVWGFLQMDIAFYLKEFIHFSRTSSKNALFISQRVNQRPRR
jgi:hypothetical protein